MTAPQKREVSRLINSLPPGTRYEIRETMAGVSVYARLAGKTVRWTIMFGSGERMQGPYST